MRSILHLLSLSVLIAIWGCDDSTAPGSEPVADASVNGDGALGDIGLLDAGDGEQGRLLLNEVMVAFGWRPGINLCNSGSSTRYGMKTRVNNTATDISLALLVLNINKTSPLITNIYRRLFSIKFIDQTPGCTYTKQTEKKHFCLVMMGSETCRTCS